MRRIIPVVFVAASAVGFSGVAMAPLASAATEPTVISASATPKKMLLKVKNATFTPQTTLAAAFDDPDSTIGSGQYTIVYPNGDKYGPFTAAPTRVGSMVTYSVVYIPNLANPAGEYKAKFLAVPKVGTTYAVPHVAKTTFKVLHQTRMNLLASPGSALKGQKVKFYGYFYPAYSHVKGKKLILSFKPKGKTTFTKVATTRVKASATFNFDKFKVTKSGKYRVKFKGTKYYIESRKTIKYSVF